MYMERLTGTDWAIYHCHIFRMKSNHLQILIYWHCMFGKNSNHFQILILDWIQEIIFTLLVNQSN